MDEKPNCIIFAIDTLRADHLGCYGYFRNTSPNIDKLANEGVLFKDSHATAVSTGPGFTSILTGLSPIHHHFYVTPWNLYNLIDFDDSIPTLPELVQEHIDGCTTAAFDNLINFYSHMDQCVRGFEYYINLTGTPTYDCQRVTAEMINRSLIPWLKAQKNKRFFLFIHYWDPHTPYNQPETYRRIFHHEHGKLDDLKVLQAPAGYQYVPGWGPVGELWEPFPEENKLTIDMYDGEICYVDHCIGEVITTLKELGIKENTVVLVTSDHGEQLGQHGLYDHRHLHESVVQVPLVLWAPNSLPKGKKIDGYVQHADIAPTILSLLGANMEKMPRFDGEDLSCLIEKKVGTRKKIFIEDHEERAVIDEKWKYIRSYFDGKEELYDMMNDPMEILNLTAKFENKTKIMRDQLFNWVDQNLQGQPDPLWIQIAEWSARWAMTFKKDFPDLKPRQTIIDEAGTSHKSS